MDLTQAVILSIVEGVTEFLPISSTGHLILASNLLNISQTNFVKSFEIIIQFGAILSIILLYWKTLFNNKKALSRILIAFLPAAFLGLIFYRLIKEILIGNELITIIALFIGGIILIVLELIHKEKESSVEKIESLSLKRSFVIGIFQSFAIIPGVSRAAATIIGALFLGAKRKTAVEFSFLLAVPTMLAATILDLFESDVASFTTNEIFLLSVGFLGSFLVATLAVKFLLNFIKTNNFIFFGIYRIILAIAYWFFIIR